MRHRAPRSRGPLERRGPRGSRGPATLAIALVAALLGLVAAAPGAPALPEPACAAVATLRHATDAMQDDGGSGGDAADGPDGAVAITHIGYSWGWLDPPVARDGADLEDWFGVHLSGDTTTPAMAEVVFSAVRNGEEEPDEESYVLGGLMPEGLRYRMDVYRPGATEPTYHGVPNTRGGEAVEWPNDEAGVWHIRVYRDLLDGGASCGAAAPLAEPPLPPNPLPLTNYGVYFGCRPHCLAV